MEKRQDGAADQRIAFVILIFIRGGLRLIKTKSFVLLDIRDVSWFPAVAHESTLHAHQFDTIYCHVCACFLFNLLSQSKKETSF